MRNGILIIQRMFPNYRKEVFDHLKRSINIELLHSRQQNGVPEVVAEYSKHVQGIRYSKKKESRIFLNVFPHIIRKGPNIIIHEFSIGILSLIPTMLLAKIIGSKCILWGHGYDHNRGFHPDRSWHDKIRIFLAKRSDAVLFYSEEAREKFKPYLPTSKLFVAHNCLNTNKLTSIRTRLDHEGKSLLRKRIGFIHPYNIIYIGRMLESKKPQILLEVGDILARQFKQQFGIHFVGDGPYLSKLQNLAHKYSRLKQNIFFHGQVQDDQQTGELLYASDLLVIPGYVGLSVNHALNFDCPVVTFEQQEDGPFHSPEISYIVNGETGFMVKEHTPKALAQTIAKYLDDTNLKLKMKAAIRNTIDTRCSLQNFIQGFTDAIMFASKKTYK